MRSGMTLRQIAKQFGVAASTARLWQAQGYFPNATLEETGIGPVWIVPASDVKAFTPPVMGRPATKEKKPEKQKVAAKPGKRKASKK